MFTACKKLELTVQVAIFLLTCLLQEAKTHREKELKKAEEDLNKIKKQAEESSKEMKSKKQVSKTSRLTTRA